MDSNSNQSASMPKIIGAIVAILVCCACVVILAAAGMMFFEYRSVSALESTPFLPPIFENTATPLPPIELTRPPIESIPPETLQTLLTTIVPANDPYELACRLKAICDVATTVPAKTYKLGDQETFWAANVDTVENFQAKATLRYLTPHMYFWIENGASYQESDVKKLGDSFEDKMYPTDREFFGSEWTPGVDEDPHIYILFVRGTGASNAGYYSSPDEYNPLVKKYSNGHEIFVFNADNVDLASEEAYSVLAHEFQHMIHWHTDANESTWMNEGFSVVAELLNGYPVYFDQYYVADPDLGLTDWEPDPGSNGPHYGESFLYLAYFLDRYGEDVTKEVVKNSENGLTSIDDTLQTLNITDPQTGRVVNADDVFMDWAAALYLMDSSVEDGRYHYKNYPDAPKTTSAESISSCPSTVNSSVNQYGIDYYTINCAGDHTLHFSGSTIAGLLPVDAHSGKYAFWSNKGDESDMTLTREFDFTNVSGPVTFSYQTWFDIEENWDYLFLEASTDGQTWQIVKTPSSTDTNPSGNSYGWGYTGATSGWIQESVDLSQFAGQKVQIRFEYVTDAAINGEGMLLDDIAVDAINYQSDFEADDGGWIANGFVRVENVLPQTYRLSLIIKGDTTTVTPIELNADQTADIPLSLKSGDEAVLIVTGTTRFTTIPAAYQIEVK